MTTLVSPPISPLQHKKLHTPKRGKENFVEVNLQENDDEAEKRARKQARKEEERRRLSIGANKSPARKTNSGENNGVPALSQAQLSLLYSNCLQLSAENKITSKNAWNLNLIDYMGHVVKGDGANGKQDTDFVAAGCTLDASTKIYANRVDSVHTDTYKVLGGFARSNQKKEEEEGEHEANENYERVKEPKERKSAGTTLASETALNSASVESEACRDPMFSKTAAAFDQGGARGLLLNALAVYNYTNIVFDSSDLCHTEPIDNSNLADEECDLLELNAKLFSAITDIASLRLCPSLSHLLGEADSTNVNAASAALEKSFGMLDQTLNTSYLKGGIPQPPPELSLDEAIPEGDEGESQWNDNDNGGGACDDDDDDMDDGDLFSMDNNFAPPAGVTRENGDVSFAVNNDFEFFEANVNEQLPSQGWTGVRLRSHWKFAPTATASKTNDEGDDEDNQEKEEAAAAPAPKTKATRTVVTIDFSAPPDANMKTLLASSKASTTLPQKDTETCNDNLLPTDHQYSLSSLVKLFLKPHLSLSKRASASMNTSNASSDGLLGDAGWYNYNNENDVENFVPVMDFDDDGADDDDDDDVDLFDDMEDGDLDLLNMPRKVGKVDIGYATQAKRIDVKALKESIWKTMTNETNSSEVEQPQEFDDLLSKVPADRFPQASVSIAFICLLHLANEKCLAITDREDLTGLHIEQDRD